jgi:hypothetical protein
MKTLISIMRLFGTIGLIVSILMEIVTNYIGIPEEHTIQKVFSIVLVLSFGVLSLVFFTTPLLLKNNKPLEEFYNFKQQVLRSIFFISLSILSVSLPIYFSTNKVILVDASKYMLPLQIICGAIISVLLFINISTWTIKKHFISINEIGFVCFVFLISLILICIRMAFLSL